MFDGGGKESAIRQAVYHARLFTVPAGIPLLLSIAYHCLYCYLQLCNNFGNLQIFYNEIISAGCTNIDRTLPPLVAYRDVVDEDRIDEGDLNQEDEGPCLSSPEDLEHGRDDSNTVGDLKFRNNQLLTENLRLKAELASALERIKELQGDSPLPDTPRPSAGKKRKIEMKANNGHIFPIDRELLTHEEWKILEYLFDPSADEGYVFCS